jgi:hypothetical protein
MAAHDRKVLTLAKMYTLARIVTPDNSKSWESTIAVGHE